MYVYFVQGPLTFSFIEVVTYVSENIGVMLSIPLAGFPFANMELSCSKLAVV